MLGWLVELCLIIGMAVWDRRFDRRLLFYFFASIIVVFVNPYGWSIFAFYAFVLLSIISLLPALKWRDIDFKKGLIRLEEAKTGKTRNIVLNGDMITLLQSLPVKCQYVFPNKHGKPFRDVKISFERALKEAKIEQSDDRRHKIVFHTLRRTCVSLLTERGADTTAVKN